MKPVTHSVRQATFLLPTMLTLLALSAWSEPGIAFAQSHHKIVPSGKATLQTDYDRLIQQTETLLRSEQYTAALEKGCRAVALNKRRAIGHQYCAVAYHRLRLWSQAEQEAALAVQYASVSEQSEMLELQSRVKKAHRFAGLVKSAEQAADAGLQAKAAVEYTEAWKLFPNQAPIGLRAATLWKNVQRWTECASVLNHLPQSGLAPELLQQLNELQQEVKPTFERLYAQALEQAFAAKQQPETAAKHLTEASDLLPDRFEAYYYLAMLSAPASSPDDSLKMLGKAVSIGKLTVEQIMSNDGTRIQDPDRLDKFWDSPAFLNFVRNAYGPSVLVLVDIQKTLKIPDLNARVKRMADLQKQFPNDDRILVAFRNETGKLIDSRLQQALSVSNLAEKVARLTDLQREYPGDGTIKDAVAQAMRAKQAYEVRQARIRQLNADIAAKRVDESRLAAEISMLTENSKAKRASLGEMKRDIPGWQRLQQAELRRADQSKDNAESEESAASLARQLHDNIAALGHDYLAYERRKDERGYRNRAAEYENKINQINAEIDQAQTELASLNNRRAEAKDELEQVQSDLRDLQQRLDGV